ncbi:MAG: hypothetical protein ACREXK_02080 [Gammaproteobacteria bacterium]
MFEQTQVDLVPGQQLAGRLLGAGQLPGLYEARMGQTPDPSRGVAVERIGGRRGRHDAERWQG